MNKDDSVNKDMLYTAMENIEKAKNVPKSDEEVKEEATEREIDDFLGDNNEL